MEIQEFGEPRFAPPISWDGASIRYAELLADTGALRSAADLCEWLLTDERLQGVIDTRVDTLLGFQRVVEGGPHSGQLEDDVEQFFDEPTWKQFHTWGLLLNVALAEIFWVRSESGREIPKIKVWNPRWLRWDFERRSWMLTVSSFPGAYYGNEVPITPGDGRWVLWSPHGSERPWSRGAYRALAKWALLKANALRGWAIHADKLGMGILVGTGLGGTLKEQEATAARLKNLGRNASVGLGAGADLKLVESTQRTWENYQAQLDKADNGFAIAILGQDATTNASSSSSARVLADVARGRIVFDAENSDTLINSQLVVPWSVANWGSPVSATVRRVVETEDDRSKRASQQQMTAQAASTLKSAGANLDLDAIATQIGLPITTIIKRIQDKLYEYHFKFGIISINEARSILGLPPIEGGDSRPVMTPESATIDTNNANTDMP